MEENKKDVFLLWRRKYKNLGKMEIILGKYNLPTLCVCVCVWICWVPTIF